MDKHDYLTRIYAKAIRKSKRPLDEQLRLTQRMIRIVLFLVIGALCYAAVVNLTIAELITIGIPTALIALVLQLFYAIEHRTEEMWETFRVKEANANKQIKE